MKRIALFIASIILLSSCAPTLMYNWGGNSSAGDTPYENLTYQNYDKQSPETLCKLIILYEDMTSNPGGTRKVPAPGICAEYGYLLMQPEVLQTFTEYATKAQMRVFKDKDLNFYFREHGKEMFEKEIKYYPESATFIKPLVKKLSSR